MAITKRPILEVDVLDSENGKTYTYTVKGCETHSCAIMKAIKMHGPNAGWAGNVRIQS
jgi:hypothetical protein